MQKIIILDFNSVKVIIKELPENELPEYLLEKNGISLSDSEYMIVDNLNMEIDL